MSNVKLTTNHGDIIITLDTEKAPNTAANFQQYVEDGFFDGVIFHRVISGFMVQGGGFTADMEQKEGRASIKNESANGLKNELGTLAMARTGDPHSASSQFFINLTDNSFLDKANSQDGWGYAVFAKVTEGMDIVDKIAAVKTGSKSGHQDVPEESVIIEKAEMV